MKRFFSGKKILNVLSRFSTPGGEKNFPPGTGTSKFYLHFLWHNETHFTRILR